MVFSVWVLRGQVGTQLFISCLLCKEMAVKQKCLHKWRDNFFIRKGILGLLLFQTFADFFSSLFLIMPKEKWLLQASPTGSCCSKVAQPCSSSKTLNVELRNLLLSLKSSTTFTCPHFLQFKPSSLWHPCYIFSRIHVRGMTAPQRGISERLALRFSCGHLF